MKDTIRQFLQSEFSFYGTIIGTVFIIAGFYYGLCGRLDRLEMRLDAYYTEINDVNGQLDKLDDRLTVVEKNILILQNARTANPTE